MPPRNSATVVRQTLLITTVLAISAVLFTHVMFYRGPIATFALAVWLAPALVLPVVIVKPLSTQTLVATEVAVIAGAGATVANSYYMSSTSCIRDALCALNVVNPVFVYIATFGAATVIWTIVRNLKR
jgi:hypothetical protein